MYSMERSREDKYLNKLEVTYVQQANKVTH